MYGIYSKGHLVVTCISRLHLRLNKLKPVGKPCSEKRVLHITHGIDKTDY